MPTGLVALLDDISVIAKAAAASIDDVGLAATKAGTKAAGVVIDDAAVTPSYVTEFTPDRELPIIWQIAKGSLKNKLLILLPAALLLSEFLPNAITPLLMVDPHAVFYMGVVLVATLACATLSHAYLKGFQGNQEEVYLLLTLSALGAMVLICSRHLASLFIGLELLSVPVYGLVAYTFRHKRSLEAGIKYLVLSAAASAFLLFGMALLYAESGSLSFPALGAQLAQAGLISPFGYAGIAMILAAMAFKLSLAPFHLWTPDVYEGAPTPVTAFFAAAPKLARRSSVRSDSGPRLTRSPTNHSRSCFGSK